MKTVKYIILFVFCFISFNVVYADEYYTDYDYTCSYNVKFGHKEYSFYYKFNVEHEGIFLGGAALLDKVIIEKDSTLKDIKEELYEELKNNQFGGKCDTTLLVFKGWSDRQQKYIYYALFNDTLEANAYKYADSQDGLGGQMIDIEHAWAEYDAENSTGEPANIVYNCTGYESFFNKISNAATGIKDCESNCTALYSQYEKNKKFLKEYCRVQAKYLDYKSSCLALCLNSENEIEELGIENLSTPNGACGFSEKLILFIANIVKWLKYIIPVIVIVLGILDFIQAISADKDDEMKKAQGKFVIRLIAAALIFIIPFIIEFVLDKMGFSSNGCGIIDL